MKRRPSTTIINLIDEVEQALGLEIFANIGAVLFASMVSQAASTLRAPSPKAARIQPCGSQHLGERRVPRGHVCVAHHWQWQRRVGHGHGCRHRLEVWRCDG